MNNNIINNYHSSILNSFSKAKNDLVYYTGNIASLCQKKVSIIFSHFLNLKNPLIFQAFYFFKAKKLPSSETSKISFQHLKNKDAPFNAQSFKLLEAHLSTPQLQSTLDVLNQLFNIQEMSSLQLLTGGRGTSKIFKFEVSSKEYVLRVTDTDRPSFFIDVKSEINNMETVKSLDISPKTHYSDAETGIIVMEYIKNIRLTTQIINHEEESHTLYSQFATTLRTLHTGPAFEGEISSVFDDIRRITKTVDHNKIPPESLKVINSLETIEDVLKKYQTSAPCHKELNGNNVLYDGNKIYFIDWEGSGNCDPFVDLAISSVFFIFDQAKEEIFLENYFLQKPSEKQKAYLFLMKHVIHTFYFLKSLRRVVGLWKMDLSREKSGFADLPTYKEFILNYFNGCSKVCDAKDFKTLTYGFLEQAIKNMKSNDYVKAIEILS